jgi:immune inhibitor A
MRKLSVVMMFLVVLPSRVWAMPVYIPEWDTTGVVAKASAFEPAPPLVLPDGVCDPEPYNMGAVIDNKAELTFLGKTFGWTGMVDVTPQAVGFNILHVCVDFSDNTAQTLASSLDSLVFGSGNTVTGLYRSMSYGRMYLTSVNRAVAWLRAPNSYSYYVGTNRGLGAYPQNSQGLMEWVVSKLDTVGVDFSKYDNNGDGYCDGIIITHSGTGAEFSGSMSHIWSHKWGINAKRYDNVWVSAYSVQPEFWQIPGDMTIGVYAHEIGHLFGLPDLYDVDGSSSGIGKRSLMAGGSWNGFLGSTPAWLDAWCRVRLGWASVVDVTYRDFSNLPLLVPASTKSDTVLRVWASGYPSKRSILIENRSDVVPSPGVCVWFCDESQTVNSKEWCYPAEVSGNVPIVRMIQLDAACDLERSRNQGDVGDPLFAGDSLGLDSLHPTLWYDGVPSLLKLWGASVADSAHWRVFGMACDCPHQGDADGDGDVDLDDLNTLRRMVFENLLPIPQDSRCPYTRIDVNCDGAPDILDWSRLNRKVRWGISLSCAPCQR